MGTRTDGQHARGHRRASSCRSAPAPSTGVAAARVRAPTTRSSPRRPDGQHPQVGLPAPLASRAGRCSVALLQGLCPGIVLGPGPPGIGRRRGRARRRVRDAWPPSAAPSARPRSSRTGRPAPSRPRPSPPARRASGSPGRARPVGGRTCPVPRLSKRISRPIEPSRVQEVGVPRVGPVELEVGDEPRDQHDVAVAATGDLVGDLQAVADGVVDLAGANRSRRAARRAGGRPRVLDVGRRSGSRGHAGCGSTAAPGRRRRAPGGPA